MPRNLKTPKALSRVNGKVVLRNAILAACAVLVFVVLCSLLLNLFTRHNRHKTVPDFTGRELSAIEREARRAELRLEVIDSLHVPAYPGGVVLDQYPAGGAKVKAGRRVFLTTNAYRQRTVQIPYVAGFSLRQAKNDLEVVGLEIEKLTYRPDMASNYVLEERFEGELITRGSALTAEVGSGITLVVGMGDGVTTAKVPKLVGFPLKEAKSRLWEMGLNVGRVTEEDDITPINIGEARVSAQSPEQGTSAILGRTVDFTLTLDAEKVERGSQRSDRSARQIISTQRQTENDTIPQGE